MSPTSRRHRLLLIQDEDQDEEDVLFEGAPLLSETCDYDEESALEDKLPVEVLPAGSSDARVATLLDIMEAETQVQPKLKYPKSIFFIISNEFCERFSYYGMRTVLVIYLNKALKLQEDTSTIIYHVFTMLCYFFPLMGGILADSWLGKFNTIAYVSLIYAAGNVLISFSSATSFGIPSRELAYVGLLLIAVGTGGIKPCVSAFGGDQFKLPEQERQLATFFSIFYFSINAGSLISTFLTPELRTIPCLGSETCYPLAFGIPALLMVVSVVIFVSGKSMYIINKPQGNMVVLVFKCMFSAVKNKLKGSDKPGDHWLDYADSRYDARLRSDIRAVLRVLVLFVPLPVFWALFDQQGSRWTFQATNMNGRVGGYTLKPDQMQVVNPLLILIFLPMCETLLYPALAKCNMLRKPLQKIATGGMIAALAFVISGVLELQLQPNYAVEPSAGLAQVRVFNGLPCNVTLSGADVDGGSALLGRLRTWTKLNITAEKEKGLILNVNGDCASGLINIAAKEKQSNSYQLYLDGNILKAGGPYHDSFAKDVNPTIRILYHFQDSSNHYVSFSNRLNVTLSKSLGDYMLRSDSELLEPGMYQIEVDGHLIAEENLDVGGVYTILIDGSNGYIETTVKPNTIHLFWLLPQYIIITLAEVMFSVTGLEFSFTQAPASMKSVITSAYLLTTAFGNLIVVLIAEAKLFENQAYEFFLFAGLMTVTMIIFIMLAMTYKYVNSSSEPEENAQEIPTVNRTDLKIDRDNRSTVQT